MAPIISNKAIVSITVLVMITNYSARWTNKNRFLDLPPLFVEHAKSTLQAKKTTYGDITHYRLERQARFRNKTEFETYYNSLFANKTRKKLVWKPNQDQNGTILDFAIIGFAKCGTTSMEANLGKLAPMPVADICTPLAQTAYYSNVNWVDKYDPNSTKPLRGTKCPQYAHNVNNMAVLPRMKLIVGIRHPISWFQSHWNMMARNDGIRADALVYEKHRWEPCRRGCGLFACPNGNHLCMARGRFHVWLATMGKTHLTEEERQLLSPRDVDGGRRLKNEHVPNPVFLYTQTELRERYVWDELAEFLQVPHVPSDREVVTTSNTSKKNNINICDHKYDAFRAKFMPMAYNMSRWLIEYLVPVARDANRPDMVIPGVERFVKVVEGYKEDPCEKLIRLPEKEMYVLKSGDPLHWPTDEELAAEQESIRASWKRKKTKQRPNLPRLVPIPSKK